MKPKIKLSDQDIKAVAANLCHRLITQNDAVHNYSSFVSKKQSEAIKKEVYLIASRIMSMQQEVNMYTLDDIILAISTGTEKHLPI